MSTARQQGFSLVELAIVILIMGLILGGLAMPLAVQRDNARIRDARDQLESIHIALEGFVIVNGFLPCPATPASDGLAQAGGGNCAVQHGFVPATTLNLSGSRNDDSLLLDPWGSPVRYSVSAADADADGNWDFITPGEMRDVTMPALTPDLVVCSTAAGSSATNCAGAAETLSNRAPAVLYSIGKDWASFSSADQVENVGTTLGGGASGVNYRVASDVVFVSRGPSEQAGDEYDDIVLWTSQNSLYRRMVDAGHLP